MRFAKKHYLNLFLSSSLLLLVSFLGPHSRSGVCASKQIHLDAQAKFISHGGTVESCNTFPLVEKRPSVMFNGKGNKNGKKINRSRGTVKRATLLQNELNSDVEPSGLRNDYDCQNSLHRVDYFALLWWRIKTLT